MSENNKEQSDVWRRALEVLDSQVLAIIQESKFYHQDEKNISGCGASVENFVRDFLKTILPSRFNIKSGYIVVPNSNGPLLSKHMDIVLTDALVPDSLLPFSNFPGLGLIPYEAVVGIVEVKRTLTKSSFLEAYGHLERCYSSIQGLGNDLYELMLGGLQTKDLKAYKWRPFLSIISICNELIKPEDEIEVVTTMGTSGKPQLSFIASLDGYYIGPVANGNPTIIEDRKNKYDYRKSVGCDAVKMVLKHLYFHLRQTAGAWANVNMYW